MNLIAYPPVLNATRVARRPKVAPVAAPKRERKQCPLIDRAFRAQLAFDEFNREGLRTFRERGTPQHFREIIKRIAEERKVSVTLIASKSHARKVVWARNAAMYAIKQARPTLSSPRLAKWFDRDHTSVLHGLANHAHRAGLPNLTGFDIDRVRRRNARLAAELRGKQAEHLRRER
jgi:hypothetical protein